MKIMRIVLKTTRVFGFILMGISCIWLIPVAVGALLGLCVGWPGLKMWQCAADKLDTNDKEIEVVIGEK